MTRALITPLDTAARRAFRSATAISGPMLQWALDKAGRSRGDLDLVLPLSDDAPALSPERIDAAEERWRAQGLRLDGLEKIAACFGALSSAVELDTVVEALDHIPLELRESLKFLICGGGERLDWFRRIAADKPQLVAPGYVLSDAISSMMKHAMAGLLIYPNRMDFVRSYPNKVGEYLAGALPIVSTLAGATGRLIEEHGCGIVVPSRDPERFARSLVTLASDDALRRDMSLAASKTFLEFSTRTRIIATPRNIC